MTPPPSPRVRVLERYVAALGARDFEAVKALFAPGARVATPLAADQPAGAFFDAFAAAAPSLAVTPIDLFESASGGDRAIAHFHIEWALHEAPAVSLPVMDLFTFEPGSSAIARLDVVYDTGRLRPAATG